MDGDYNTAYYTKGSMDNYGTIDLRSQYDLENQNNNTLGLVTWVSSQAIQQ